jgi:hypothetical protein
VSTPGYEPLDSIVAQFPGLSTAMKFYERNLFVPVRLGTITTPRGRDAVYRDDCKVRGLYVVDRAQLRRRGSDRRIKQDYLVAWLDDPKRPPDYYSGQWRNIPPAAKLYLRDIATFCGQVGVLKQYGCDDNLDHHYTGPDDPRLKMEDPWPAAFADAWREALELEGLSAPA